jgi:hypothetical protein
LAHLHASDDPTRLNAQFRDAWQAQVAAADARHAAAEASASAAASAASSALVAPNGAPGGAALPLPLPATKGPSLLRTLVSAFGRDYAVGVAVKFVYDASQFIGPLLLQKIIVFLAARQAASGAADDEADAPPMRQGYELVFLLLVNSVVQVGCPLPDALYSSPNFLLCLSRLLSR